MSPLLPLLRGPAIEPRSHLHQVPLSQHQEPDLISRLPEPEQVPEVPEIAHLPPAELHQHVLLLQSRVLGGTPTQDLLDLDASQSPAHERR